MDTKFSENRDMDVDMDTKFLKNRDMDVDMDTEFSKNRDMDVDMDTRGHRCPPTSASNLIFDLIRSSLVNYTRLNYHIIFSESMIM